ncbi:hypothetical protein AB836_01055 [Rickettsiales bacterium (ex Bugula neritina AB1)]|nr:hypothetical protein AB836_01055 [Rickettsiales bacterium (ex Bugula neritina AB1)]
MIHKTNLLDFKSRLKNIPQKKILVLNSITLYMKDLIPHDKLTILSINNINNEHLFSIEDNFYTKEKFFFRFLQLQKQEIQKIIKNISKDYCIITPYGLMSGHEEFILTDVSNNEIFITTSNILLTHIMYCTLKPIQSLLISIFKNFSFLLKDFIEFIIITNSFINIGNMNNDNMSFRNFLEAIIFLEKENWKFKKENIDIYTKKKKTNFYKDFQYWKKYFKEEDIQVCNCKIVSENSLESIFYGNLNKFNFKLKNYKENKKKREIIINFKEEKIISNPISYYLNKVLKIPFANNFKEKKQEIIKLESKKTFQLKIIY